VSDITEHQTIRTAAVQSDRLLQSEDVGVSSAAMSRMERSGNLHRVVPGVYVGAEHVRHPLIEGAGWTLRYPPAVVCLLTAAEYFDLADAFPRGTWLYVPKGSTVPRSKVASLQIVQTAERFIDPSSDPELGIATLQVHGVDVRITNRDRTVLDLWRYPARIPAEYALEALRRRAREEDFNMPAFGRLGRRLGVWKRLRDVVQGMVLR
jgi:predicted transcriptional regulator of viral defense system